ncbi:MAG: DUF6629 family protein [Candidatus Paceibacterota bacterium]
MCFSAPASFIAGTALTAAGVVTISKTKKPHERAFASIPLLFGLQQLLDGIAWVSMGSPLLNSFAAYGYGFFAYLLWPVFVPVAVLSMEKDPERRKVLTAITLVGIAVGLYALYLMLAGPITAQIINHCIRYDTVYPYSLWVLGFYLIATCGSCFVSSHKFVRLFGIVVFIGFVVAGWFYLETFSSVWCFFAAILSGIIYWHFDKK